MELHSIDDDFIGSFNRLGYVCLKDLFSGGELAEVRHEIIGIFEELLSGEGNASRNLIAATYDARRDEWRACAKQMSNSIALARLSSNRRVVTLLKKLGLRQPAYCVHPEVRVDMPSDEQYMQPWHQDWRSGQGSWNSVTVWLPLHDVTRTDGAIDVLEGTHLWGLAQTIEKHNPRRFEVIDQRLAHANMKTVELTEGQCAVFSQLLVHRSGKNIGTDPRLTCQLRFADLKDPTFKTNLYRTPVGSELIWHDPPRSEDMRRIHSIDSA